MVVGSELGSWPGKESESLATFPADVSARDFLELAEKLA